MKTMRAMVTEKPGDHDVMALQEALVPGDVLVRNFPSGVALAVTR